MSPQTGCKCKSRTCENKNNKQVKSQDEAVSVWWVNSPQDSYCFWKYVSRKSGPDGSMPELVQAQIADLMGWSNTKTHFALKEAMVELIATLKSHKANELLEEDPELSFDLPSITMAPTSSEDYE